MGSMSSINVDDRTHEAISDMAHDQRTSMKIVTEKMWQFVSKRKEGFVQEMF